MTTDKHEVFGVVWFDLMLGTLSLTKPNAEEALTLARHIQSRGEGKVQDVRLVHLPEGSDTPTFTRLA